MSRVASRLSLLLMVPSIALAEQPRHTGTAHMAALLRRLAEEEWENPRGPYTNSARAEAARRRLAEAPPDERRGLTLELGLELMNAGQPKEAAEIFESELASGSLLDPGEGEAIRSLLAAARLRQGEQANCVSRHTPQSCLFPVEKGGVHALKDGSRAAAADYLDILRRKPDDASARWLLNIAMMTLGEYPHGTPERWRIPPEAFRSEQDFPRFPNRAGEAGVDRFGHAGGVIMEDFDGDGLLDLLLSSSGAEDQLRYYRGRGDGRFDDRTREAGLSGIVGGLNLLQADYDNDGRPDALLLRGGWLGEGGHLPMSLLRNLGGGRFADLTEDAGLFTLRPTQTAAWADFDRDGHLDLFVGFETEDARGAHPHPWALFRNEGDGTFTDISETAGVARTGFAKGCAAGDYDDDGWPDLYVSRMDGPNALFHNERDGTFKDVTAAAGVAEPEASFTTWFWDFDNDGRLDLFVAGWDGLWRDAPAWAWAGTIGYGTLAHVAADFLGRPSDGGRPRLYRNNGDGTFTDVAKSRGLDKALFAMGGNFGDLDNDGWLDFYLGTGAPDLRALMPNRLFRNDGGAAFRDVTTAGGFGDLQKGHGIAIGDLRNRGWQDVFLVSGGGFEGDVAHSKLFVNPGGAHHFISLRLEGVRSNRSAIGARVKATVVDEAGGTREIHSIVSSGGSFGASSFRRHLGLGDAAAVRRLELRWPSGAVQTFHNVKADRYYWIREGGKLHRGP